VLGSSSFPFTKEGEVSLDRRVTRIAARRYGVVSREQAVAAGFTQPMIDTRLRTTRWVSLYPGVYLIDGAPITDRGRALAAALAANAHVSHCRRPRSGA
jgi:hypothetical protein